MHSSWADFVQQGVLIPNAVAEALVITGFV